jgi:hypothetical protein
MRPPERLHEEISALDASAVLREDSFGAARTAPKRPGRRSFIGGSDACIIMGNDDEALVHLWREKRGGIGPDDFSGYLGVAAEELNRIWYEHDTGRRITNVQRHVKHSAISWMVATLAVAHRRERAFDDIGRTQMLPVFGRKVIKGE